MWAPNHQAKLPFGSLVTWTVLPSLGGTCALWSPSLTLFFGCLFGPWSLKDFVNLWCREGAHFFGGPGWGRARGSWRLWSEGMSVESGIRGSSPFLAGPQEVVRLWGLMDNCWEAGPSPSDPSHHQDSQSLLGLEVGAAGPQALGYCT